ncbi:MAG: cell division protein FtsZ, partial [Rhodobacteraceae bacterium]|nr:cell division protein FtsZ [Paracoccaceae bacterium]
DTLIIIPNQNLFRLANEKTTFTEAFSMADDVLYQGVKGVTDLMVRPGLINLDFADVRAVMDEMGKAMMGTGEAEGEDRAIQAAEKAIANPLLDEISLRGAKGVLINITGSHDLTLFELDEAANRIREEVDPDANIIVGSTLDETMNGMMRVSVVATGIDASDVNSEIPVPRRPMARPLKPTTSFEDAQKPAEPAPAPVHEPMAEPAVAARQAYEPVAAEYVEAAEEPSLFDGIDSDAAAALDRAEGYYEDEPASLSNDGLPPPAYQPQVAAFQPQRDTMDAEPESFVAPKAPLPGTPTPEMMDRLRAATARVQDTPQAPRPVAPAPAAEAERSRFGINSLINRMTGHAADTPETQGTSAVRAQPSVHQPSAGVQSQPSNDPDQDRIEIPAFLRRQAN